MKAPDRRSPRNAVVQPRQLPDDHRVRRLDADGEAIVLGRRAAKEPPFGAADIQYVARAVIAQHLRDSLPTRIAVPDIGEAPAADLDRLVSPAWTFGDAERTPNQAKCQAPAKSSQDSSSSAAE
jgi:hypothetical protein